MKGEMVKRGYVNGESVKVGKVFLYRVALFVD